MNGLDAVTSFLTQGLNLQPHTAFDRDGGIVNVPNTGVYTTLVTLNPGDHVFLEYIGVTVFDPGAISYLTWRLLRNGILVDPWFDQRMPGGQLALLVRIGKLFSPGEQLLLQAAIGTASPLAFDTVGRVIGSRLRWTRR